MVGSIQEVSSAKEAYLTPNHASLQGNGVELVSNDGSIKGNKGPDLSPPVRTVLKGYPSLTKSESNKGNIGNL